MQKFWNYIENEPIGIKKILSFFIFWLFIYVTYISVLMLVYPEPSIDVEYVKNNVELKNITFQELAVEEKYSKVQEFAIFAVGNVYDAFIEEVFFRFMPFFLLFLLYSKIKFSQKLFRIFIVITIAIAVFIYSVLSHGSFLTSLSQAELIAFFRALLVQGVGGFLLSIVYLKFGGIRGNVIKPLFFSFFMHWSSNLCLSAISILFFL